MFGRVGYVEFTTANGEAKRLTGIDFKFSVNKFMGSMMNEGQIEICNLPQDDIEFLTTFTSQWIAYGKRKRLRVFAGYKDTNTSLIFDGDITEALPSAPPDVWLRCKAMTGAYGNSTIISKSITEQVTVKDLLTQAADWTGLEIRDYTTTTKNVSGFFYTGSATQVIRQINNIPGIICYEDDGALCVVDEENPQTQEGIRNISETSGMIGIPQPDPLGCRLQILLDPAIKLGQRINLISTKISAANGVYWIYELKHHGHLRGNEWYTDLSCRRVST